MGSRRSALLALLALGAAIATVPAAAQDALPDANGITSPSMATSFPNNADPGGIRRRLAEHGITYNLIYTNDVLGNVSGGLRRGTIDQGKLEVQLSVDLEKFAGWKGLSFYANGFDIRNTGRIRRDYVGGINTIAAIEGVPATRLSELWLEQKFLDGKVGLRFGQIVADNEFFYSDTSLLFLQSDWPTISAVNLPSGAPAYPLSTPGVRLKLDPNPNFSLLLAMFNGDPAGPGPGDEQIRNHYGLNFRVTDPPLFVSELQYRWNHEKDSKGLAGQLKLGGWLHTGKFEDRRFGIDGLSLANPASNGIPFQHRSNLGVYGIIDQQLYRPAGGSWDSGISVFAIGSVTPSDRNLVDVFLSGGIVFAGMIPGRPDDKFGASVVYARFSDGVRGFDADRIAFTGLPLLVRDYELNLELTYQAQIIPGWTIQPDFQYIWHPTVGDQPSNRHAMVVGLRSIMKW